MEEGGEPLLAAENEHMGFSKRELFAGELKRVSYIAMPMVVVSVSQYLLRAASMMMLGHLGDLALSSAAIAISLSNVTGFSLLVSLFFPCSAHACQLFDNCNCVFPHRVMLPKRSKICCYGAINYFTSL